MTIKKKKRKEKRKDDNDGGYSTEKNDAPDHELEEGYEQGMSRT